jgi:hypothetical protein
MGRHLGVGEMLHALLPGYNLFRFHPRFQLYAVLAVAVLGAFGLSEVERRLARRNRALAVVVVALLLCVAAADLVVNLRGHNSTIEAQEWTEQPESLAAINRDGQGPAQRLLSFDPQQQVFLGGYLRGGGWSRGAVAYEPARQLARDNYNLLFDVAQAEFYLPLYPQRARAVTESLYMTNSKTGRADRIHSGLAALFNVGMVLASERQPLEGMQPVRSFPAGDRPALERIIQYQLPEVMPRAFLVPSARVVRGEGYQEEFLPAEQMEALLAITARDFDPGAEVVIDLKRGVDLPVPSASTATAGRGAVTVVSYEAERVVLDVRAATPAWLFLSDTFYPGWRAHIDGQSATIFPANLAGRAVWLPEGEHQVEFVFRSGMLHLGAVLALLALISLVWIATRFRLSVLD